MIKKKLQTIINIQKEAEKIINKVDNFADWEKARVKFLGRKSELNKILKSLKDLEVKAKKRLGSVANQTKQRITQIIEKKKQELEQKKNFQKNKLDVTLPVKQASLGHQHLLSQVQQEIEEIFKQMGFEIADGPEVETEWYNFTALNVPADHPARDMQDTFWLKQTIKNKEKKERLVARTQTSNVQIHFMQNNKPPLKIVAPGRVFRNEATDANHEHTFYQFEALVVDKNISVANFKDIAQKFFTAFFGKAMKIRLRPSYFPFTEPSFEFDISCTVCGGKGCRSCKQTGWLEIGGSGMVNQRVFKSVGYKKGEWQGFAWGFGIDRLAMMKYKINDIRLFESGDLRFIKQF